MLNNRTMTLVSLLLSGILSLTVCILWYSKFTKFIVNNTTITFNIGYSFICNLINSILTILLGICFYYNK